MYRTHFGFTHYPFERALQPDELFAAVIASTRRLPRSSEYSG